MRVFPVVAHNSMRHHEAMNKIPLRRRFFFWLVGLDAPKPEWDGARPNPPLPIGPNDVKIMLHESFNAAADLKTMLKLISDQAKAAEYELHRLKNPPACTSSNCQSYFG